MARTNRQKSVKLIGVSGFNPNSLDRDRDTVNYAIKGKVTPQGEIYIAYKDEEDKIQIKHSTSPHLTLKNLQK